MKDKILTLIIGILIGAVIMACVFLTYTKNNEKKNEDSDTRDVTITEEFQKQGFPKDENMPDDGFGREPRGDFKRDENFIDSEDRPELPDENFTEEMPSGKFTEEKSDGEPPVRTEDNKNVTDIES